MLLKLNVPIIDRGFIDALVFIYFYISKYTGMPNLTCVLNKTWNDSLWLYYISLKYYS